MEIQRGVQPLISITMACFMIMLFVGPADCAKSTLANMSDCYGAKYGVCALKKSKVYCAGKAMSECAKTDNRRSTRFLLSMPVEHQYCFLGCTLNHCIQIDPKEIKQLAKCFETCSENMCKPKTSADEQTKVEFCKLGCANSVCGETTDKDTVCGSCDTTCS